MDIKKIENIYAGSTVNIDLSYKDEDGNDVDLSKCDVTFSLINESTNDILLRDIKCDPSDLINISDTITSSLIGWYKLSVRINDNGYIDISKIRLQFVV